MEKNEKHKGSKSNNSEFRKSDAGNTEEDTSDIDENSDAKNTAKGGDLSEREDLLGGDSIFEPSNSITAMKGLNQAFEPSRAMAKAMKGLSWAFEPSNSIKEMKGLSWAFEPSNSIKEMKGLSRAFEPSNSIKEMKGLSRAFEPSNSIAAMKGLNQAFVEPSRAMAKAMKGLNQAFEPSNSIKEMKGLSWAFEPSNSIKEMKGLSRAFEPSRAMAAMKGMSDVLSPLKIAAPHLFLNDSLWEMIGKKSSGRLFEKLTYSAVRANSESFKNKILGDESQSALFNKVFGLANIPFEDALQAEPDSTDWSTPDDLARLPDNARADVEHASKQSNDFTCLSLETQEGVLQWLAKNKGFIVSVLALVLAFHMPIYSEQIRKYLGVGLTTKDELSEAQRVISEQRIEESLVNDMRVTTRSLDLRKSPRKKNSPIIATIPAGRVVEAIGKAKRSWICVLVVIGGELKEGWIYRRYTKSYTKEENTLKYLEQVVEIWTAIREEYEKANAFLFTMAKYSIAEWGQDGEE